MKIKMKYLLSLIVLCVSINTSFAQGPSLTKEETVNYIEKKAQEADGKYRTVKWSDDGELKQVNFSTSISIYDTELYVTFIRTPTSIAKNNISGNCMYFEQSYFLKFKMSQIQEIRKYNISYATGDPVNLIEIVLKNKTGTFNYKEEKFTWRNNSGSCTDWKETGNTTEVVDKVYIPYFQNDPTNFDKIKKALLYLKELCDAEEDPFGN